MAERVFYLVFFVALVALAIRFGEEFGEWMAGVL